MRPPKASAPTQRPRRRWVIVLLVVLLLVFGGVLALLAYVSGASIYGFMPPQMAAAYYTPKDVVGDLGGMPVTIAHHIPQFVEYDGDPGWGQKRQSPPPARTHASKLASFGFDVRYPDMATLSSPELWKEFESKRLYDNPWIRVSIQSGSAYPGHGFLDRRFIGTMKPYRDYALYGPAPSPIKGLELFVAGGINRHTGQPWRYEFSGGDLYIHRNHEGRVTTFIRCTFRSGMQSYSTCGQDWSMEAHSLKIDLRATYVPGLLSQWEDIQRRVSHFVLDFKDPSAVSALALAP